MSKKWSFYLLPAFAMLLWLVAVIGHRLEDRQLSAREIARDISLDLKRQQQAFSAIAKHQQEVLDWISLKPMSAKENWLFDQPFYVFAFQNDSMVAWSSNSVLPREDSISDNWISKLRNGQYLQGDFRANWLPAGISLKVLFPISVQYPLTNDYLKPAFLASEKIPPDTRILRTNTIGAAPILDVAKQVVGFVPDQTGVSFVSTHYSWINWAWVLAIAFLCLWIHRIASRLRKGGRCLLPLLLIITSILVIRGLMYWRGLPFHMGDINLFSPRLYATNSWLPSLGDLLFNVMAAQWLAFSVAGFVPWEDWKTRKSSKKILFAIVLFVVAFGIGAIGIYYVLLIRSLVLDSVIPFDTTHLASLDITTLTGLFIATLMTATLLTLATILRKLVDSSLLRPIKGFTIVLFGITVAFLVLGMKQNLSLNGGTLLWLLAFVVAQSLGRKPGISGVFRPVNVLWSVGHCMLLSLLLFQFITQRETETRKTFAEHVASRHDDALEYNFGQVAPYLATDTGVVSLFKTPSAEKRKAVDERLSTLYFNSLFASYEPHLYFFDTANKPIFNADTSSLGELIAATKDETPSKFSNNLFYRESAPNNHTYLGILPIKDDNERLIGSIIVDLEQKKIVSETVLPELLQSASVNKQEKNADYSFAVYVDDKLVAQTSDFPFPFQIPHDTSQKEYRLRMRSNSFTLIYTPDDRRTVFVWQPKGGYILLLSLFSYLLLFRFLLLGTLRFYRLGSRGEIQIFIWNRHQGLSLRKRVQASVLGIVLFSFLMIGTITVWYLRNQYASRSEDQRQSMMQTVTRAIQEYMKDEKMDENSNALDDEAKKPKFKSFLSNLASAQKIDINLFDASGRLSVSTQQTIYDQGLLAPVIRPKIFAAMLDSDSRWFLMEQEGIGKLNYISCYTALRSTDGKVAGFVNVPLFYSQRALDEQISNVVVALINLYAIIFLLSSILAVLITRWITRAFDVIIKQFGRLSLHGNQPLDWPYDDEVGILVAEYNKMVKKVEENVALLARSEREGAWREMAKQVAHEIKNPLTPMSLNIQYLQRAIKSGQANTDELVLRTSESLLEQINNLSVIASEFSQFARIGAKPERIDLDDLIPKVVDLYTNESNTDVSYQASQEKFVVVADRSQLVRILTNLLQNALQAIPDLRRGKIEVRLFQQGNWAIITVEDNGSGISEEAQAKMFTPYFTTKSSGTGLGLAMTRQMIEQWGGQIRYDTTPEVGTRFELRFPLVDEEKVEG
ncbi:MAG: HAMP domain-containing sensor histidine kinase [Chitinophagaceae bacterium]